MATSFTNTAIDHTSDAGFRAWGSELSGQLTGVGTTSGCLTQTADTGQINWVTVNRPGTNTAAGYEIWQLTDALGVSAPVYLKVEYGTGGTTTTATVWITVGQGSNGSGTLTGNLSTRVPTSVAAAPASTAISYPSYVCANEGFVGVATKIGSVNTRLSTGFFVVRPCDLDGTLRSDGIILYTCTGSSATLGSQTVNFASGILYGSSNNKAFCMIPNEVTSTAVGSDIYAFRHQTAYPQIHSNMGLCTVLCNEMGQGTSDTATLNGATPHTYVQLGSNSSPVGIIGASVGPTSGSAERGLCMLWE